MNRIALLTVALSLASPVGAAEVDWSKVDQAIGRKGAEQAGGVHRYGFPRSDLHVAVDGVAIKPALALGGWVALDLNARSCGAVAFKDRPREC